MNKIISFKKLIYIFTVVVLIFVFYHFLVWTFWTSQIFDRKDGLFVGDLGRLSYQIDSLQPRKIEFTLPKKHLNNTNWNEQNIDIMTVGDSFSNGGGGGINSYYQDHIASKYNINILNLHPLTPEVNPIDLLIYLYNTKWLHTNTPKAILIEIVERQALDYFAKDFDWSQDNLKIDSIVADSPKKEQHTQPLGFINNANYKIIYYTLKYKKKIDANKGAYLFNLNKELFNAKSFSNKLLVYDGDINNITSKDDKRVEKLNNNLNKLAVLLNEIGVELFFMPVVDKYDLYYNYISNNPYEKNHFFDILRVLDKQYTMIDTKNILNNLIIDNIKDIYYADDTHWSYKASEAIVEDKSFRIFR